MGLNDFLGKVRYRRLGELLVHHDKRPGDDSIIARFIQAQHYLKTLFTSTANLWVIPNIISNLRTLSLCEIQEYKGTSIELGEILEHATRLEQLAIRWPIVCYPISPFNHSLTLLISLVGIAMEYIDSVSLPNHYTSWTVCLY